MVALSSMDFGFRAQRGVEPRRIADANVQIGELEALRLDAGLHAPRAAGLAEPLVSDYRAIPTSGDHLRLPLSTNKTGPQLRRSIDRFLATPMTPSASEEVATAIGKLHRLLGALRGAHERIQTE